MSLTTVDFSVIKYLEDQGFLRCYEEEDPEADKVIWLEIGNESTPAFVTRVYKFKNYSSHTIPTSYKPSKKLNEALINRFGWGIKNGHKVSPDELKSGGCYITTATLTALNKNDNCYELNKFREFRDSYLITKEPHLIDEYYRLAPKIVNKINSLNDKETVYNSIWSDYLSDCLSLIESNRYKEATNLYIKMVNNIKEKI